MTGDRLRLLSRRLRSRLKRRVFAVRRWRPDPPLSSGTEDGALAYDVLWRTAKHRAVQVDAPFQSIDGYPVAGSIPLPLIDIRTRTGETYLSISFCPATGAVFHRLLPEREWQHAYYARDWDRGQSATVPTVGDLLAARPEKVGRILGRRVSAGMRVLDIGCGYGDQLYYLKQRGCMVQGVEPSRHRADFANTHLGVPALNCPIDGGEIRERLGGSARFDLIYLNQVLEHLNDPLSALRAIRPLVADGGALMIGVPDLFSESLASFCGSIVHTHSFSATALRNLAAVACFRPTVDLSFPGYLYMLFAPVAHSPALRDVGTKRVLDYVAEHFALGAEPPASGSIISISSTYTGATELGLRARTAPQDRRWRAFRSAIRRGDVEALRQNLPIAMTMPFDAPVIWQK